MRKLVDRRSSHGTTMISIVRAKIAASLSAIRSLPISVLVSCATMRRSSAVADVVRSYDLPPRSFLSHPAVFGNTRPRACKTG